MELAFGLAAYYQRIGYAETGQAVVSRVPAGQWAPDRDGDDTSFWFDVLCVSLLIDLDRLSRARSAASRILSRLRGGASSPEALRRRGAILNLIGLIERAEGRPDHARKRLRAALRCLPADDADIAAQISNNLGLIELDDPSGDAVRAEKLLSDALSRFVELGDKRGQAEARINLGLAAERRGALDIADEMYSASLALELELGHRLGVARALTNLAEVASVKGEAQRAYREQIVAEWLFAEIASPYARSRNWLTEKVKTEAKARREDVELALASFAHFDLRRLIEWATLAPPV
jgi:tetratricopeptide (TPR) repeat protein